VLVSKPNASRLSGTMSTGSKCQPVVSCNHLATYNEVVKTDEIPRTVRHGCIDLSPVHVVYLWNVSQPCGGCLGRNIALGHGEHLEADHELAHGC
jgi:hypothetical protein